MKTSLSFSLFLMLLLSLPSHGQILKKLQKRAENAVENTVLNRAEREAAEKTDQILDGVLEQAEEQSMKGIPGISSGDLDKLPDRYEFSYKATMKFTSNTKKESLIMNYWLQPHVNYMGTVLQQDDSRTLSIWDMDTRIMALFTERGTEKFVLPMAMDQKIIQQWEDHQSAKEEISDLQIQPIEDKTILGYHCKGYEVTNEEGTAKIWITDQTPVGMLYGIFNVAADMPKPPFDLKENSMILEMQFNSGKDSYKLECTEFTAEKNNITKADYGSM